MTICNTLIYCYTPSAKWAKVSLKNITKKSISTNLPHFKITGNLKGRKPYSQRDIVKVLFVMLWVLFVFFGIYCWKKFPKKKRRMSIIVFQLLWRWLIGHPFLIRKSFWQACNPCEIHHCIKGGLRFWCRTTRAEEKRFRWKIKLPSDLTGKLICTKGPTGITFAYTGVMTGLECRVQRGGRGFSGHGGLEVSETWWRD